MSMQDWDDELETITAEVHRLAAAQRDGSRAMGRRTLVARKVDAVQAQIKLDRALDRLRTLTQKDLLLLPRDKAVLHWGRIYTGKAAGHMELLGRVLTKNLWLKLVTLRSGELLDGDQLVGLSVRSANLGKTERYLRGALEAVTKQQRQLVATYHTLAVEKANREAAACMSGRLGLTWADAAASPVTNALTSFFMHLTAGTRGDAAARAFFEVHRRYEGKAHALMNLCRNTVLNRGKNPGHKPHPKAMDKFAAAMRQLDDLEAGVKGAYQEIIRDQAPKARPRVVKAVAEPVRGGANSDANPERTR